VSLRIIKEKEEKQQLGSEGNVVSCKALHFFLGLFYEL
jgi:hypothetical protein